MKKTLFALALALLSAASHAGLFLSESEPDPEYDPLGLFLSE